MTAFQKRVADYICTYYVRDDHPDRATTEAALLVDGWVEVPDHESPFVMRDPEETVQRAPKG